MNKYKVIVQDFVLQQTEILVEAESEEVAKEIAETLYSNHELELLESLDYITIEENFTVYEADEKFIKDHEDWTYTNEVLELI